MLKLILPVLAALSLSFGAGLASAAPIAAGSTLIFEDDGLAGVCAAPCYVAQLDFEVWAPSDMDNPLILAGNNTYIYELSNLADAGASLLPPGLPITSFELEADFDFVSGAGVIANGGIAPTSTTISGLNAVSWAFPLANLCPACLIQGETSDLLYIHSPLSPGDTGAGLTAINLDASFTTTGPVPEPTAAAVFAAGLAVMGAATRRRR